MPIVLPTVSGIILERKVRTIVTFGTDVFSLFIVRYVTKILRQVKPKLMWMEKNKSVWLLAAPPAEEKASLNIEEQIRGKQDLHGNR